MAGAVSARKFRVSSTPLGGVLLLEPRVFEDERGYFLESYNRAELASSGIEAEFVQDNHSHSERQVLRGLHYQLERPQGKLIHVVQGEIFDVAVDLRRSSPTFGAWFGDHLSAQNRRILWIPPGLAHGFLVLSGSADVHYKCTDYYRPEHEFTIHWEDPRLGIRWPLTSRPTLSPKDAAGLPFEQAPTFA